MAMVHKSGITVKRQTRDFFSRHVYESALMKKLDGVDIFISSTVCDTVPRETRDLESFD